jgi:hypothetical protein
LEATVTEHVSIPSVEERLRVCLALAKTLFLLSALSTDQHAVQLDDDDGLHQAPELTRRLREHLVAVRAALPAECIGRDAPPADGAK